MLEKVTFKSDILFMLWDFILYHWNGTKLKLKHLILDMENAVHCLKVCSFLSECIQFSCLVYLHWSTQHCSSGFGQRSTLVNFPPGHPAVVFTHFPSWFSHGMLPANKMFFII